MKALDQFHCLCGAGADDSLHATSVDARLMISKAAGTVFEASASKTIRAKGWHKTAGMKAAVVAYRETCFHPMSEVVHAAILSIARKTLGSSTLDPGPKDAQAVDAAAGEGAKDTQEANPY